MPFFYAVDDSSHKYSYDIQQCLFFVTSVSTNEEKNECHTREWIEEEENKPKQKGHKSKHYCKIKCIYWMEQGNIGLSSDNLHVQNYHHNRN